MIIIGYLNDFEETLVSRTNDLNNYIEKFFKNQVQIKRLKDIIIREKGSNRFRGIKKNIERLQNLFNIG
ncbi:hypothetical protein LCGC14_0804860 [marine sediment metagenome]|uniref:Uncharacterized protein n=1 Tax=marine sediment metagenome TaxID=412755 RepID=A0A0F9SVW2_9ZZZZ